MAQPDPSVPLGRTARGLALATASSNPWIAGASALALLLLLLAALLLSPTYHAWIVFLSGMLAASVLACVSHTVNARWFLALRSAQLEATRRKFFEERKLRRSAELAAARAESHARIIDRTLPAIVAYIDSGCVIRYHNEAYTRWVGVPGEAIDGNTVASILGPEHYAVIEPHLSRSLSGEEVRYERTRRMGDGATFRLFAHYVPHFVDGKVAGVFAILTDITRPEDLEREPRTADTAPDEIAQRMREALQEGRFCLYSRAVGALDPTGDATLLRGVSLRLREEEDKHLPPGTFFAIAEELGLVPELDRWTIRKVLEQASADPRRSTFLVQVDRQSVVDRAFAGFVAAQLEATGVSGERLWLEFGEADIVAGPRAYRDLIEALAPLGCRFAVGGFGRNPKALPLLKQLDIDYLKLDGGLVVGVARDGARLSQLAQINAAAHAAGMRTIADCVEDDSTRAALVGVRTDFAAGDGIGSPEIL